MTTTSRAQTDYYLGARWFVGGVSFVLIAALSLWLLSALARTQALVERMVVEQTVQNIRTGLKVAMSEAVSSQHGSEISAWAGQNPIRWLASAPPGYEGGCNAAGVPEEGGWCFDSGSAELLYRPRYADGLSIARQEGRPPVLRWRIALIDKTRSGDGVGWLGVENVTPYQWVIE